MSLSHVYHIANRLKRRLVSTIEYKDPMQVCQVLVRHQDKYPSSWWWWYGLFLALAPPEVALELLVLLIEFVVRAFNSLPRVR